MASRNYARPTPATSMNPRQLAASIDTALARTGHVCDISGATITVTHPALVAGNDATINAQISAYSFDPDFDLTPEQRNLRVLATLRQWATDARTEAAAWAGQTQAQRDNAMNTMFTRLGTFFDRFSDLLTNLGLG